MRKPRSDQESANLTPTSSNGHHPDPTTLYTFAGSTKIQATIATVPTSSGLLFLRLDWTFALGRPTELSWLFEITAAPASRFWFAVRGL